MQYEARGTGGNRYLYKSERHGGKVRKVYLGRGELIDIAYQMQEATRQMQLSLAIEKRIIYAEIREQQAGKDKRFQTYLSRSYALASTYLMAAGCHRPKRGAWRRKRGESMAVRKGAPVEIPTDAEGQMALIGRAMDYKRPEDVAAAIQLVQSGNCKVNGMMLAEVAAIIDQYSEDDPLQVALQKHDFGEHFKALTGAEWSGLAKTTIPPMEYILAERVLLCRMQMIRTEATLARATTFKTIEFAERRVDQAQRRYLAAIKTLAEVKRLRLPVMNVALPGSVQVNNAEKQINFVAA